MTRLADTITAATNDETRALNERIRAERVRRDEIDDARTVFGNDGLSIGVGDVIQTRRNESTLGVANRQTWTVQHVGDDGVLSVVETGRWPRSPSQRLPWHLLRKVFPAP